MVGWLVRYIAVLIVLTRLVEYRNMIRRFVRKKNSPNRCQIQSVQSDSEAMRGRSWGSCQTPGIVGELQIRFTSSLCQWVNNVSFSLHFYQAWHKPPFPASFDHLKNCFYLSQKSFVVRLTMTCNVPTDKTSTETVAETIENSQEPEVRPKDNSSITVNSSSRIEPHSTHKRHHRHDQKQFCRKCCHTPP